MTITRANVIKYWASGPTWTPVPEGYIALDFSRPCFPDLATLSPEEKDLLRPALAAHPEYLCGAILSEGTIQ
jgi:hypothetical protein